MADLYLFLAGLVLVLHVLFNGWIVGGALLTKGHPSLERLHILSLFYGVVMENVSWACPLTVAQKWFLMKAGQVPYPGAFLVHLLRTLVAPTFPIELLRWGAIGVFFINMIVYARRYERGRSHAYHH